MKQKEMIIAVYDLEGKFLDTFNTVKEAQESLEVEYSAIWGCLNKRASYAKFFQFLIATDTRYILKQIGNVRKFISHEFLSVEECIEILKMKMQSFPIFKQRQYLICSLKKGEPLKIEQFVNGTEL